MVNSGYLVRASRLLVLSGIAFALAFFWAAVPASAGQASLGEPLFYPCTSCHPVAIGAGASRSVTLPNKFKGHQIVLVQHDRLGVGVAACLVCHDDPARDPGKLKLIDGSLVDITGDVSSVCYRCHSAKYKAWKAGTHGKHEPKCTAAGCHDPHTPGWVFVGSLMPFVGSGFQTQILAERQPFTPLFSPPPPPPVYTPSWVVLVTALGVVVAGGIAGALIRGRSKR